MMTEELKSLLENYNQGLTLYRERKFKEAKKSFKKALEAKSDDGPSKLYVERCDLLIKDPPPKDWDAVVTLTSK